MATIGAEAEGAYESPADEGGSSRAARPPVLHGSPGLDTRQKMMTPQFDKA